MLKKTILILLALCILAAPVAVYRHFNGKGPVAEVEIPPGVSASKIADILKEDGIIKSKLFFKICLKISGAAPLLRSGSFALNKNTSSIEVIWRLLNDSGAQLHRVTVLEGWRIEEIAEELQRAGIIADKQTFIDAAYLQDAEGYLFPSTYLFPQDMPAEKVVQVMMAEHRAKITPLIQTAIRLGRTNLNEREILALASIVEREALFHDERPKIAAVYLNRIKIGKKLEADPTVQYAIGYSEDEGRHWKKRVLYKDLRHDSPYNTYRYQGLPPGPIANPGISSVQAVLEPQPGFDALYFVADSTGRHIFSVTYNQHVQNIQKIRD
ncbi:MAG: endolytic transglycosylase MltG [Elusimicrobiota bacterium]|jgi:UPF0755 protein|nr:endolytic transglycosylase MltG [Elusimicrobiota bacterium]